MGQDEGRLQSVYRDIHGYHAIDINRTASNYSLAMMKERGPCQNQNAPEWPENDIKGDDCKEIKFNAETSRWSAENIKHYHLHHDKD